MDEFRSCTSHKQYVSSFLCCKKTSCKLEIYCFETWGFTTVMFPYDCGTIPHSLERNKSSLKHNLNSSTRPVSVQKVRKLPGVFKQVVDMFNRLFTLDAVPPLHSSKNPPRNLMLYFLCSQVVSHQCPAMVQSVTVEVTFYLIVEVHNIMFN